MLNYVFTITNPNNNESFAINDFVTDPDNFIALQEYPLFDVDVKNQEADREGQHGIWDFKSFYGKRIISFSGVIVGESEASVETQKKQMLKVLTLPPVPSSADDGYLDVTWTDANSEALQLQAKLQVYPRFERSMKQTLRLRFNITLKAKNPEIESQTEQEALGIRGWEQGNVELPLVLPATMPLYWNNQITIDNTGTVEANTIVRMYGEAGGINNPVIYNITTGKLFKVNVTLADETEYIEINSKTGTVVDQDGVDRSGDVDSTSEFILLTFGENVLVYYSDESEGVLSPVVTWEYPTAVVSVKHRTTII